MNKQIVDALRFWGVQGAQVQLIAQRENQVYRVDHASGTFALRHHREGLRTPSQLGAELSWMTALGMDEVPVPRPVATIEGSYICDSNGQLFSMIEWVPGTPLSDALATPNDPTWVDAWRQLGETMRGMHNLAPMPGAQSASWRLECLDRPRWDAEGLLGDTPTWNRFWDCGFLSAHEQEILTNFRAYARSTFESSDDPSTMIHADCVPDNVLFHNGQLTLIDFDDCGWGSPYFDVATVIVALSRKDAPPTWRRAFLDGYGPIGTAELAVWEAVRACSYIGWISTRLQEPMAQVRAQRFVTHALELIAQCGLGPKGTQP